MVQLKRKIKLKQKTDSSRPKPFFANKVRMGLGLICLLAICGISYAVYKNISNSKEEAVEIVNESDSLSIAPAKHTEEEDSVSTVVGNTENLTSLQSQNDTVHVYSDNKRDDSSSISSMSEHELEEAALSVIRGNYGNNPVRRRKLGNRYQQIQDRVNQMYREGKVR